MRVWDAELLTKRQGYVKNGLVLWIDAIDNTRNGHNAESSKWEDLSGNGNDATIYKGSSGHIQLQDNAYVFSGKDFNYMIINNFGDQKVTYEAVFELTAQSRNSTILSHCPPESTDQKCALIYHTSGNKIAVAGNVSSPTVPSNSMFFGRASYMSVVYNPLSCFINGQEIQLSEPGAHAVYVHNKEFVIGAKFTNVNYAGYWQSFQGKIHSIRVYNRALTTAEIAQNYRVDQERFGVGLS